MLVYLCACMLWMFNVDGQSVCGNWSSHQSVLGSHVTYMYCMYLHILALSVCLCIFHIDGMSYMTLYVLCGSRVCMYSIFTSLLVFCGKYDMNLYMQEKRFV